MPFFLLNNGGLLGEYDEFWKNYKKKRAMGKGKDDASTCSAQATGFPKILARSVATYWKNSKDDANQLFVHNTHFKQ